MTELEPRENPAIPVGLTEVPSLILGSNPPPGYEETHSLTRNETITVTVDQAGTGSAGTFTIDVVGSAGSGDTAEGEGDSGSTTMTASGTGEEEFSWHIVLTGAYADGVFTVLSKTYTGSGSYSSSQNTTWTQPAGDGFSNYQWDTTRSGEYTLSWSAEADANGELVFTGYSYSVTDTAHWHTYRTGSGSEGYTEAIYDASVSIDMTWTGGTSVAYTGRTRGTSSRMPTRRRPTTSTSTASRSRSPAPTTCSTPARSPCQQTSGSGGPARPTR